MSPTIANRPRSSLFRTHSSLITRRSRVQIPPPLLKALASVTLARASTVLYGSSTESSTGPSR